MDQESHELTLRVRYAETDQMGFVHHSVYFVWFEEARSDYLRVGGSSYQMFENEGLFLPVSEVTTRFLAPARFDQAVTIRVRLARLRSRQVEFEYEVVASESGQLLATGRTTHIVIDRSGAVASLPPHWRELFARGLPLASKR